MRRILVLAAVVLAAMFIPGTASARPTTSVNDFAFICDNGSGNILCLWDPSDGGTGNNVLVNTPNGDYSYDFDPITDTSRCGGFVTDSCPFTNKNIDNAYEGDRIVVLKQHTTQLCLRIPASTFTGVMGQCDTGSEPSTAFIFHVVCGGACNNYVAVDATNNDYQAGATAFLTSPDVAKNSVGATNDVGGSAAARWVCQAAC